MCEGGGNTSWDLRPVRDNNGGVSSPATGASPFGLARRSSQEGAANLGAPPSGGMGSRSCPQPSDAAAATATALPATHTTGVSSPATGASPFGLARRRSQEGAAAAPVDSGAQQRGVNRLNSSSSGHGLASFPSPSSVSSSAAATAAIPVTARRSVDERGFQWPSREQHEQPSSVAASGFISQSRFANGEHYRPRLQTNIRAAVQQGCYSDEVSLEDALKQGGHTKKRSATTKNPGASASTSAAAAAGACSVSISGMKNLTIKAGGGGANTHDDNASVGSNASDLSAVSALSAVTERLSLAVRPFQTPLQRARSRQQMQMQSAPVNLNRLGQNNSAANIAAAGVASRNNGGGGGGYGGNADWGAFSPSPRQQGGGGLGLSSSSRRSVGNLLASSRRSVGNLGQIPAASTSSRTPISGANFGLLRRSAPPGVSPRAQALRPRLGAPTVNPFLQESANLRELLAHSGNDFSREVAGAAPNGNANGGGGEVAQRNRRSEGEGEGEGEEEDEERGVTLKEMLGVPKR